jgi:hypothetical protein
MIESEEVTQFICKRTEAVSERRWRFSFQPSGVLFSVAVTAFDVTDSA